MEVFVLKTNITSKDLSPEIIGVYDSYSIALKAKEDLLLENKDKIGDKEERSEITSDEKSEITFVYPKNLDGPVYWYAISKKELNEDPETWIVYSDVTKEFGIFTSREKAEKAIKDRCKKLYDKDLPDEQLKSSYIQVIVNNKGFSDKNPWLADVFFIRKVKLNDFTYINK